MAIPSHYRTYREEHEDDFSLESVSAIEAELDAYSLEGECIQNKLDALKSAVELLDIMGSYTAEDESFKYQIKAFNALLGEEIMTLEDGSEGFTKKAADALRRGRKAVVDFFKRLLDWIRDMVQKHLSAHGRLETLYDRARRRWSKLKPRVEALAKKDKESTRSVPLMDMLTQVRPQVSDAKMANDLGLNIFEDTLSLLEHRVRGEETIDQILIQYQQEFNSAVILMYGIHLPEALRVINDVNGSKDKESVMAVLKQGIKNASDAISKAPFFARIGYNQRKIDGIDTPVAEVPTLTMVKGKISGDRTRRNVVLATHPDVLDNYSIVLDHYFLEMNNGHALARKIVSARRELQRSISSEETFHDADVSNLLYHVNMDIQWSHFTRISSYIMRSAITAYMYTLKHFEKKLNDVEETA